MKKVLYMFAHLVDADIDWMIQKGKAEAVPSGGTLITEGADNNAVFIVLEGELSVSTTAAGELTRVEWGEVLGEMSLVDGRPASATVKSAGDSRVLRLPRTTLENQLARDVGFASRLFRGISVTLSERLRSTTQQLEQASGNRKKFFHESGELSAAILEDVHLAGARFDRLLKATLGTGGARA